MPPGLGRAATFGKYLASVHSLYISTKSFNLEQNHISASNLLNFGEMVGNDLMKNISTKNLPIFPFLMIAGCCF